MSQLSDVNQSDPDDAAALLQLACDASGRASLEERRRETLDGLLGLLQADAAWWAWGHGHPVRSAITPAAIIHVGFSPDQLGSVIQGALLPETTEHLKRAVAPHLEQSRQRTSMRADLINDEDWQASEWRRLWKDAGFVDFLHSVRYHALDVWTNLIFYRKPVREAFSGREHRLVDVAMAGITWLQVRSEEAIPAELLPKLTPRLRAVLLLLLDGRSRKEIADTLGISDHTAHEHIKDLYRRMQVKSVSELAGHFLRSKS